jgi:uncharacterized protein (DUF1778 family)
VFQRFFISATLPNFSLEGDRKTWLVRTKTNHFCPYKPSCKGAVSALSLNPLAVKNANAEFMPRPLKTITERRCKRLEIRLTDAEEQLLKAIAADGGLSISEHIRKVALGSKPRVVKASPERAAFIQGLAALGKMGSNVNQIAKALNTDLAAHLRPSVSPELIQSTLFSLQTLSRNLLKHLSHGHPGEDPR